jgi:transcriptional regulator with XRE-family HTH domain
MSKSKPRRNESEAEILRQFGNRIKELRQKKGYSQEELAQIAGFSRSYYAEIETGSRNVSLLNLLKILKHLDANASELSGLLRKQEDV